MAAFSIGPLIGPIISPIARDFSISAGQLEMGMSNDFIPL